MKKIIALLLAIITVFGITGTAFALVAPPENYRITNTGDSLVIKLYNSDTLYRNTVDNVTFEDNYASDVWQIGKVTNSNYTDNGKPVVWAHTEQINDGGRYKYTQVTVRAHNDGNGKIYLAKYAYDNQETSKYKCTVDTLIVINYKVKNKQITITGGELYEQGLVASNNPDGVIIPNSHTFTKYTIPKNWDGLKELTENGTVTFEEVTKIATKKGGCTKAVPFTGKHTHTENVKMPFNFKSLYTRVKKTNGKNDLAEVYFRVENDHEHSKIGYIPSKTIIGKTTNSGGIIWAKPVGNSGRTYLPVSPCKEGDGTLYFAVYTYDEELMKKWMSEQVGVVSDKLPGTPYAIYQMDFKVVKGKDKALHFENIHLSQFFIGTSIYSGGETIGEQVISHYECEQAKTFLTKETFKKLLDDTGLPSYVYLHEEVYIAG